jgi:hypothetical protein
MRTTVTVDPVPGPDNGAATSSASFILPPRARIAIRVQDGSREDHHLWNNHGTWFIHFTVYPTPLTKERIRVSTRTRDLVIARARRDELFDRLKLLREIRAPGRKT